MSLPLAEPGWQVRSAGTVELDSRRNPQRVGPPVTRGPYAGHASLVAPDRAPGGAQSARWAVVLDLEAWPVERGDELLAPDGAVYAVATAVRRPGPAGSDLGHVACEADRVVASRAG